MRNVAPENTIVTLQNRYLDSVNSTLRDIVPSLGSDAYALLRYHLGWEEADGTVRMSGGGKALRPILCLTAADLAAGDWRKALAAAASLELIHNFSLIHDDIQDQDSERRHRSTVWHVWGIPKALSAGNIMRVLADQTLAMLSRTGLSINCIVEASLVLTERYLEMIEGQYQDIEFETTDLVPPEKYLEMVGRKTGALIDAAMHLGALVATEDKVKAYAFGKCGRKLGLAFQIRDDILGIWGDPKETGKPVGADIRRRKKSLPVVYLLKYAKDNDKKLLYNIYSGSHEIAEPDVKGVLQIMENLGVRAYCQEMAQEQIVQAKAAIKNLSISEEAHVILDAIAEYFVTRKN